MTPMLQQYTAIKKDYPHEILFYRMGDFYEMFMEDAELAAREMEITLTARDAGKGKKVPMCGIPYHAVNVYLAKLLAKGYHVAICEQVEDPKTVKGIVKRAVVRIVTPGTIIEESFLEAGKNNFLAAVAHNAGIYGLAYVDLSTGEFLMTEFSLSNGERQLQNELARLQAAECIYQQSELWPPTVLAGLQPFTTLTPFVLAAALKDELRENALCQRELADNNLFDMTNSTAKEAARLALAYLLQTQKKTLVHVNHVESYDTGIYLAIDRGTRRNLELNANLFGSNEKANLLAVLDKTITAAGGRKMRQWLEQPLAVKVEIEKRHGVVTEILEDYLMREEIKIALQSMYDLQRLISRCALGTAGPRELIMLNKSLAVIAKTKEILAYAKSTNLIQIKERLVTLTALQDLLSLALNEETPGTLRDGNVFKLGFHPLIDKLKTAKTEGKKMLAALEEKERAASGIKNLKVSYNKIFGYYFEITNSNLKNIPPHFIRKQTLANCERFCTEELKELEELVLNSEEKLLEVEKELFAELVKEVLNASNLLQLNAALLAELDVYFSFAELAYQNSYTKPSFTADNSLIIVGGRHPVIEKLLPNGSFIANDCQLHLPDEPYFALVTGPNMAGKSTYIRMVAVIAIMAQMGSYVPAERYEAGVVDKVFARVGAADDLSSGQSTFMVEMNEVSYILANATENSLLILDEVGRGTSTFDGLSIAWAVSEYIVEEIKARTLFATHYHELMELVEEHAKAMLNLSMAVQEKGTEVIFLRKVVAGGIDRSYGLHVAKLAGLPPTVLGRAKEKLAELESSAYQPARELKDKNATHNWSKADQQKGRQQQNKLFAAINQLSLDELRPLEALQLLYKMKAEIAEYKNGE